KNMASIEVKVPDIGDFDEVSVIELLVKTGDTVKAEQSLVTVESDKASMEIPSSSAGVVKEMKVKLGDKVKEGSVLVVLDSMTAAAPSGGPTSSPPPQPSPSKGEGSKAPAASAHSPAPAGEGRGEGGVGPIEIRVPDIGDFKDVAVIELLVKPGDTVKPEQSLITVESDKASMEIPSSAGGTVKELKVKLGDKVNTGDLVAVLEGTLSASSPPPPGEGRVGAQAPTTPAPPQPQPSPGAG